jgi:hypothetical protein
MYFPTFTVESEDQPAVERLARYIMRHPISLDRMTLPALHIGKGTIRRRSRRGLAGWVPGSNFVRRDQSCVPGIPSHRVAETKVGYSNVSRGRRRKGEAEQGPGAVVETAGASRADRDRTQNARALRRSWAQLLKRIYEVDPLVCPSCGSEMKVVAIIIDHAVVDKILRHLTRRDEAGRGRGPPGRPELSAVS